MDYLCSECSTQLSNWEVEFEEAFELSKTERGKGGYGSTGTN